MGARTVLRGILILIVCILGIRINSVIAEEKKVVNESHITILNSKNFDDIVKPAKHALIEFYAPWCGHCKAFRGDFATVAETLAALDSSILVGKVDADAEKDLGERFSIDGFPTFKFFEDGDAVSEYNDDLTAAKLVEWVQKIAQGGTEEITTINQAEEILDQKSTTVPVRVIAYFKNSSKDSREFKAFKKLALAESNGNEAVFYRTSDPEIAAKLGISTTSTSATTTAAADFSVALTRSYPSHPTTTIQFSGHKAESLSPADAAALLPSEEDKTGGALSEGAYLLAKLKSFFFTEKLPDFVLYTEALEDGGNLVMSVPIDYHMYVIAPPEKLTSEATAKVLRTIAAPLRGHFTILTANPAEEEPGMTPTMYPIAATFSLNHTLTDYFVGVLSSANGTRYTCNLPAGVEELTQQHASELVKCGQEVLAGGGLRIFNSQPAPADPIQGNFTVAVGDTLLDIIHDSEKDVLLEVYAPWCSACRAFAPEFARTAAALAGVDSVVVVKMDGSENDHKEFDVQEYPTLLFYPAEKGSQPIRVDINTGKDLIEFVHKNAKIGFTLPEYAQFEDMEVDLTEFGPLGEETEEDGVADVYDADEDTETAPEKVEEESGSSDAGHDEL